MPDFVSAACYFFNTIFVFVPPTEIDWRSELDVLISVSLYFRSPVSTVAGASATTFFPLLNTALSPSTVTL